MSDLISRQAVLDALKEHRALYCDNTPDAFSKLSYAEKSRVDELDTAIATIINLPSVSVSENPNKWIPVSERLPKIASVYRVTRYYPNNVMNPNYLVDACCFDGSNTWYNDNRINHDRAYVDNVIAWQENPEPYKPERGE